MSYADTLFIELQRNLIKRRMGYGQRGASGLGGWRSRPYHKEIRHHQPLRSVKGVSHPDAPPDRV